MSVEIGSKMPDEVADQLQATGNKHYGQNGFGGPSSDEPGAVTKSGFLPGPENDALVNSQMRTLAAGNVKDGFGMESARSRQPTKDLAG